jgi:hypothetical protein
MRKRRTSQFATKNGPALITRHFLGNQLQLLVVVGIAAFLEFGFDLSHGGRVVG